MCFVDRGVVLHNNRLLLKDRTILMALYNPLDSRKNFHPISISIDRSFVKDHIVLWSIRCDTAPYYTRRVFAKAWYNTVRMKLFLCSTSYINLAKVTTTDRRFICPLNTCPLSIRPIHVLLSPFETSYFVSFSKPRFLSCSSSSIAFNPESFLNRPDIVLESLEECDLIKP